MPTFLVAGNCEKILQQLFSASVDGYLNFGWTAQSVAPACISDLLVSPVRFRDYIMEGFLVYSINVDDLSPGCRLSVLGEGSSRDWSIGPQIRAYLRAAKVDFESSE